MEPPPPDPPAPPGVRRPSIITPHQAASSEAFGALDWAVFLAVSGIWGASFLFIAEGLEVFEPGLVTWLRVSLGAATLMALPAARHRIAAEDRVALVALSVLWVALPFTLFPLAQTRISSAVAGMLNGATPLFATLVGAVILRSLPGRSQVVGLVVGLAGVVTISAAQSGVGDSAWEGIAMVVAATACYGFAVHIAGPLQARYGSVVVMGRMLLLASLWTAPLGLAGIRDSGIQLSSVLAVVTLGTLGTGVAFALMATLVGRVGGVRASFITYLVPVIALGLGIVLRSDEVRLWAVGGVALVIVGAFLASRSESRMTGGLTGDPGPDRV